MDRFTTDQLAQEAYRAYGDAAGWLTFDGRAMPAWEKLTASIQDRWRAAARKVATLTTAKD